jgi:hypothetical protein
MIHEGMLYKCAVPPFLPYYLSESEPPYNPLPDGFDIHHHSKPYHELRRYLTDMRSKEACRYCFGDVGKKNPHTQLSTLSLSSAETAAKTPTSQLDCGRLLRAGFGYFYRRLAEILAGKKGW